MKVFFIALVLTLVSTATFADCSLSFYNYYDTRLSSGFVGPKSYKKMVRILEGKGYTVLADHAGRKTADYVLDVDTYFGYDCGTGLTWVDYSFIPANFNVRMSRNHGNVVFERERNYTLPLIVGGGKIIPRKMLMKAIRAIPKCE